MYLLSNPLKTYPKFYHGGLALALVLVKGRYNVSMGPYEMSGLRIHNRGIMGFFIGNRIRVQPLDDICFPHVHLVFSWPS